MLAFNSRFHQPISSFISFMIILTLVTGIVPSGVYAAGVTTSTAVTGLRTGKNEDEENIRKVLMEKLGTNSDLYMISDEEISSKLQDILNSSGDPKSQNAVGGAYEHFNMGMQYYRKLDLANALKEFSTAVRGYREGISVLRDNYYLLFSHLYLGITLNFLNREAEGKKFIQEMVVLDSDRKTRVLAQRDFPPKIVELHKQITRDTLAKPMATIKIESEPSGAKVIFNGSEMGKTPLQIKDAPMGQHFLALELQGYESYGSPIQVMASTQNFSTKLKERNTFRAYMTEARTAASKNELKTVAEKLGADILVLGQTEDHDGKTTVYAQTFNSRTLTFSEIFDEEVRAKKPKFSTLPNKIMQAIAQKENVSIKPLGTIDIKKDDTPSTLTSDDSMDETIQKALPPDDSSQKEFESKEIKQSVSATPFYQKWWFWGVVGLVAVGGGAFFLLKKSSAESNIVSIPNPL